MGGGSFSFLAAILYMMVLKKNMTALKKKSIFSVYQHIPTLLKLHQETEKSLQYKHIFKNFF